MPFLLIFLVQCKGSNSALRIEVSKPYSAAAMGNFEKMHYLHSFNVRKQ
jgi:hypothetical protein